MQSTTERKAEIAKRLSYYYDIQSDETFKLVARRWARPEQFRFFTLNIVKAITDKRASTYRIAPRRTFNGMDQEAGDTIYRALNADPILKKSSKLLKLTKTATLQVGWNEDTASPTLNVLTPNILDVEHPGDPERPSRIIITHTANRAEDVSYSDWTGGGYRRLNHRGANLPLQGNPSGVNPYGVLPFVPLFDRLPDSDFFLPGGRDIIEGQEALNVALASLWRAVEQHSHGQPWASGLSANQSIQFGPDRVVALPANSQFGFASPNSPIPQILSALEFLMRQLAATNETGADVFDLSKTSESGSAKAHERTALREARLDDIALWRTFEHRLFEVVKRVVNTHQPGAIPESATIAIDFAELQDQLTEAEALENARTKIELGIWAPTDAIMALSPDSFPDRAAAFAELARRRDETADLALPL